MIRFAFLIVGVALWAGALAATTQLHRIDLPIGHGLCGPWGCAAQPEALLGYHLFWLTLLGPALSLTCLAAPKNVDVRIAWGAVGLGGLGALGLVLWAAGLWAAHEGSAYAIQRGVFVLMTTPDLPVMPLFLAGIVGLGFVRSEKRTEKKIQVSDELVTAAQPTR